MKTALEREGTGKATESTGRAWFRKSAVIAAVVTGAIAFSATAASAVGPPVPIDKDLVLVTGGAGTVDFGGTAGHLGGVPVLPGDVKFYMSDPDNVLIPTQNIAQLTGRVYYDDFFTGGCGRVLMSLYNTNNNLLKSTPSDSACRSGFGTVVGKNVTNLTLSHPDGYRVKVTTQVSHNNGATWTNVASQNAYLGDGF